MEGISNAESKEPSIRGNEERANSHSDSDGLGCTRSSGAIIGSKPQRTDRTVCTGSPRRRPKPRTHGKTLGYLIEELQDQIEDCQSDRARLDRREQRLRNRLDSLRQVLAEWQETVETLAPEDPPTPTE